MQRLLCQSYYTAVIRDNPWDYSSFKSSNQKSLEIKNSFEILAENWNLWDLYFPPHDTLFTYLGT